MTRYLLYICLLIPNIILSQNDIWETNPNAFEFSMSLTCVVVNQNGDLINDTVSIGVFDSEVCVGLGDTDTYFSPIEGNLAFVVVYGNSFTDSYSIKVNMNNVIYDAGTLSFQANDILGTLNNPYIISPVFDGCTDSLAFNYNPNAIQDNGSCIDFIEGCMDSTMYNYNPLANTDDQSCIPIIIGCINENYLEYDVNANTGDESYCINVIVQGCQDDHYIEYNPNANSDDGTCNTTWQQAYIDLSQECEGTNEPNIIIDLPNGWSMFGFTKLEPTNLIDATFCITDKIIIVKDYLGAAYLPEFNFNGIGSLTPGIGYQIKLTEPVENFKFCE